MYPGWQVRCPPDPIAKLSALIENNLCEGVVDAAAIPPCGDNIQVKLCYRMSDFVCFYWSIYVHAYV